MSIATIGLIVETFLAVKKFSTINTIAGSIVTIISDRKSLQQIATDRISSCFQIMVIGVETNSAICCDLLRSPTMCYDLSRFRILSGPIAHDLMRMTHERIRADLNKYDKARLVTHLWWTPKICCELSRPYVFQARLICFINPSTI